MALFILQKDTKDLDIEDIIVREKLKSTKYINEYVELTQNELSNYNEKYKEAYPIGEINFVTKWLQMYTNVKHENPIEIPKYLRTDEFLKREYTIGTWEDIPRSGKWFIKDASILKYFSNIMHMDIEYNEELFDYEPKNKFDSTLVLHKNSKYVISSPFNIVSEYRIYVIGGEIEAIINYNGDPTILPDIKLLNKAINLINNNEKWLRSYTVDIMINSKGETAIIEIHNFASVGLYGTLWGTNLLSAYKDGITYLINDNKEIEI